MAKKRKKSGVKVQTVSSEKKPRIDPQAGAAAPVDPIPVHQSPQLMRKKIFTFAYDMLSQLERIEYQQQNSWMGMLSRGYNRLFQQKPKQRLAPFKAKIAAFLDGFLPKRDFSWNDYQQLIDDLLQHIWEIPDLPEDLKDTLVDQFLRQKRLIALQPKLPKPVVELTPAQKVKRRFATIVKSGLITPQLWAIDAKMKARGLPFQVFPPVPEQTKMVDAIGVVNSINIIDVPFQPAAEWLFHHIDVLPFKQLIASIKDGFATFEQQREGAPYAIFTTENKSQSWVPQLAMRFLTPASLPTELIEVPVDQQQDHLAAIMQRTAYKHFVYTDDASYSGMQLGSFILNFAKTAPKVPGQKIHLHVILGFISETTREYLLRNIFPLAKEDNPDVCVNIICNNTFKNTARLLTQEKKSDAFSKQVFCLKDGNLYEPIRALLKKKSKTTVSTEWKRPDDKSVENLLLVGARRQALNHIKKPEQMNPLYTHFDLHSDPLIDRNPPYKKPG